MAGTVPPVRSDSPEWMIWLVCTVVFLLGVLLVGLVTLASGSMNTFLIGGGIAVLLATLILPVWAIYGLDGTGH